MFSLKLFSRLLSMGLYNQLHTKPQRNGLPWKSSLLSSLRLLEWRSRRSEGTSSGYFSEFGTICSHWLRHDPTVTLYMLWVRNNKISSICEDEYDLIQNDLHNSSFSIDLTTCMLICSSSSVTMECSPRISPSRSSQKPFKTRRTAYIQIGRAHV